MEPLRHEPYENAGSTRIVLTEGQFASITRILDHAARVGQEQGVLIYAPPARIVMRTNASTVTVTNSRDSKVSDLEISLSANQWDLTTFGVGFTIGAAVGRLPGALVGGVSAWGWGRWRWRHVYGKPD